MRICDTHLFLLKRSILIPTHHLVNYDFRRYRYFLTLCSSTLILTWCSLWNVHRFHRLGQEMAVMTSRTFVRDVVIVLSSLLSVIFAAFYPLKTPSHLFFPASVEVLEFIPRSFWHHMGPYKAPGISCRSVGYPITDFSTLAHHVISL